jgi:hypothetical protein
MSLPKNPLPLSNGLDANGRLAANNLSAWLPCRSPFESFLKAYYTDIVLFPKNYPCLLLILI